MSKLFQAMEKMRRQNQRQEGVGPAPVSPPIPLRPKVQVEPSRQVESFGPLGQDVDPPRPTPSPQTMRRPLEDPIAPLGERRTFREGRFGPPDAHLVSLVSPDSPEAEYYQRLRHTVEQWHQNDMGQVLAITSPSAGDGKSITVLNLAGSLAREKEARVLVIDADLRQPSVDRYLGLANFSGGLNALVSKGGRPEEDILRHARFNLHVLPTTPSPTAPYEVLSSSRLHELLLRVREDFDYVLIDSPPLMYPDFSLLKTHVDGTLIVIAAHRTPRRAVEEAVESLGSSKLIGIVFNRDSERRAASYQYPRRRKRTRGKD